MALNLNRMVFESVFNIGIKRLTDAETVDGTGVSVRKRIGRMTRRAARKLMAVDFEKLDPARRVQQNAELSALAAVNFFCKERAIKKLEKPVSVVGGELPVAKTIRLFAEEDVA